MPRSSKSRQSRQQLPPPPNRSETHDDTPDDETYDDTSTEDEEEENEPMSDASDPKEQKEEAKVELKLQGPASAVQKAAQGMGADPKTTPNEKDPESDKAKAAPTATEGVKDDPYAKLLADPKNMVIVRRVFPRVWTMPNGERVKASIQVEKYECPISADDIADDVFARFGGKKFRVSIHPNAVTGEATLLGAFLIENPNVAEPWFEPDNNNVSNSLRDSHSSILVDGDPTLEEIQDPLAQLEQETTRRLKDVMRRKRIKDVEDYIDSEGDSPKKSEEESDESMESRFRALEERLALKDLRSEFQSQIGEIKRLIEDQKSRDTGLGQNQLLIELIKSSQAQFADMMKTFMSAQKSQSNPLGMDLDKMLDLFGKLKGVLGADDSRVRRLEDALIDTALDRVMNAAEGPADDDDAVKYIIKQVAPALKTYIEKQVDEKKPQGRELTPEEKKKIYDDAVKRAAQELARDWRSKGYIVKAPDAVRKIEAAPQGVPSLEQSRQPITLPSKPEYESTPMTGEAEIGETLQEGDEMPKYADLPGIGKIEIPPSPDDPQYDRKKAVNFILDSIRSEIKQRIPRERPDDTYVVGDALDCLDDELLGEFSKIETGEGLENFLLQYGDPQKVNEIKEAGRDEIVKSWIRRIIITIQDHWKREVLQKQSVAS